MFLISAPVLHSPEESWLQMNLTALNFATYSMIRVPHFRPIPSAKIREVLVEMQQLDHAIDAVFRTVLSSFPSILKNEVNLLKFLVEHKQSYGENITNFSWNTAKYPPYLSPRILCSLFCKQLKELEYEINLRAEADRTHREIAAHFWKEETLAIKDLSEVIHTESVIDTDYIQSVYVVVPLKLTREWEQMYEVLHETVISGSSCFIAQDGKYRLFTAVIIRKYFQEFQNKCMNYGFIVRKFDPTEYEKRLQVNRKFERIQKQRVEKLIRWVKMTTVELFDMLLHVKVFRAFAASISRYHEAKFQIFMFYPRKGLKKRLLDELDTLYGSKEEDFDLHPNEQNKTKRTYFTLPYLYYRLDFEFPEY